MARFEGFNVDRVGVVVVKNKDIFSASIGDCRELASLIGEGAPFAEVFESSVHKVTAFVEGVIGGIEIEFVQGIVGLGLRSIAG